jgi:hypothetical protein
MRRPLSNIIFISLILTGCTIAAIDDIQEANRKPNVLECPRPKICQDKP